MKHFFIILLICLTARGFSQTRLNGNISALGNSQVIIQFYEGNTPKSVTVPVTAGKFTWEALITEAQKITMIFPGRATYIFIDPANMTVTGSRDSVEGFKVTGSKTNDEAVSYAEMVRSVDNEQKRVGAQYGKLGPDKQIQLEEEFAGLTLKRDKITDTYIAAHPNSAFSLSLVTEYARLSSYERVSKMYAMLSKKMQSYWEGKRIADRLAILKRSAVGEKIIDFKQKDNNGKLVDFAAFKGKYVLIDFWASWCAPCRREIPNIINAYNTFKDHNFTVISISLDDHSAEWLGALPALKMPWTQLWDEKGWNNDLSVYYGIKTIPTVLLIDPNGKIVAKDIRGVALGTKLKELLL